MSQLIEDEQKEKNFILQMQTVEKIDSLRCSFQASFNEGMTDLAFLRFRDEIKGFSLNPASFVVSPAMRVLNRNEKTNKEEGFNLNVADNSDYHFFLNIESEDDLFEEYTEEAEKEIARRKTRSLKLTHNDIILDSFGVELEDPQVKKIQQSFIKALNEIIKLANVMIEIKQNGAGKN